jgi:hypothetical protein
LGGADLRCRFPVPHPAPAADQNVETPTLAWRRQASDFVFDNGSIQSEPATVTLARWWRLSIASSQSTEVAGVGHFVQAVRCVHTVSRPIY